ncbi:MAG: GGDEF domain-containing protein [Candidatus Saccharimonadales bacterium]
MTEDTQTDPIKSADFDEAMFRESLTHRERKIFELGKLAAKMSPETQDAVQRGYVDSLTGLPNRDGFINESEQIVAEHPHHENLVLAAIDLDALKEFNDTYGHDAGDSYLKFFADFLNDHLRREADLLVSRNIAGRIGGDEFYLLLELPPRKEEEVPTTLDMREHAFELWLKDGYQQALQSQPNRDQRDVAGFSIGFASYKEGIQIAEWMKLADREMYKQKAERGKSR